MVSHGSSQFLYLLKMLKWLIYSLDYNSSRWEHLVMRYSRWSLCKCCFPCLCIDTLLMVSIHNLKKVAIATSCIDTVIWVSILSNLYRYTYLCIDTHKGFGHTYITASSVSILLGWVSILINRSRYIHTCIDTFEGFIPTWATSKLCIDTFT